MTKQIGALTWIPYQGGGKGTLLATVELDSATDTRFLVPTNGMYNNGIQYADIVIIYNVNNNGNVAVKFGPLSFQVNAYDRDYLQLPGGGAAPLLDVSFTVGTIILQFYKGTPPVNPSLTNYAGAQALSNNVVFNGGLTVGLNTMSIDVATNYAANNGVIVTGTISQGNTGPVTLNVNGKGPIDIVKLVPSPFGLGGSELLLSGGELISLCNFAVSFNASSAKFDLILPSFYNRNAFQQGLTGNVFVPVAGGWVDTGLIVPVFSPGQYEIEAIVLYQNSSGSPFHCLCRLFKNGTTEIARGQSYINNGGIAGMAISGAFVLAAGDNVSLQVSDSFGGNWGFAQGNAAGSLTMLTFERIL